MRSLCTIPEEYELEWEGSAEKITITLFDALLRPSTFGELRRRSQTPYPYDAYSHSPPDHGDRVSG